MITRIFNFNQSHSAWCVILMFVCMSASIQNVNANYFVDSNSTLSFQSTECSDQSDQYGAAIHFVIAGALVVTGTITVKQALFWTGITVAAAIVGGAIWNVAQDEDEDGASAEAGSESSSESNATQTIEVNVDVIVRPEDSDLPEEEDGSGLDEGLDSTSTSFNGGPLIANCSLVFSW